MTPSLVQIEKRRRRLLMLSYIVILFLSTTLIGLLFFIDGLVGLLNAVKYNSFLRVYLIVFVVAFLLYMTHKERQQYALTEQLMDNLRETSTMLAEELKQDIFLNKTSVNFAGLPSAQALQALLSLASEHFEARGAIVNRKPGGRWEPVASEGETDQDPFVTAVADWIERTGRALVIPSDDSAGTPELDAAGDIGSVLGVPLRLRGRLHGVVALWRGRGKPGFSDSDTKLLELAGRQAATVVYNHEQSLSDQERLTNICRLVARATDRIHPEFEVSSERCGTLAGLVTFKMGLSAEEQRYVVTAAYLQNIGLLTLPANLLDQQAFTEEEEISIQNHLHSGGELLRQLRFPRGMTDLISLSRQLVRPDAAARLAGKDFPMGAFVMAAIFAYLAECRDNKRPTAESIERAAKGLAKVVPAEVFAALSAVAGEEASFAS